MHPAIKEMYDRAKRTGKVVTTVANKGQFAAGPNVAGMLPDNFKLEFTPMVTLTAGELRQICQENPNHPLATQKRMSVIMLGDDHIIACLQQDIDSLKNDKGPNVPDEIVVE